MNRRTVLPRVLLVGLLLVAALTGVRAEVSCDPPGIHPNNLFLGIIVDDPDPVGLWRQHRPNLPPESVLNSGGDDRGDGMPYVVYTQASWPVAAWSWETGSDGDIAFSEWTAAGWSPTEFLTVGLEDDLDPHVALEDDGTVHVAWWTDGPTQEVWMRTRPAGSTIWNAPVPVTGGTETGRRPSVTVDDAGTILVAYEDDSIAPGMAQDIVVATHQGGGVFQRELVASTSRVERLEPIVHFEAGRVWMEWMHDAADFGCVERVGSTWSNTVLESWPDQNWVGIETMRKVIRQQMINP